MAKNKENVKTIKCKMKENNEIHRNERGVYWVSRTFNSVVRMVSYFTIILNFNIFIIIILFELT